MSLYRDSAYYVWLGGGCKERCIWHERHEWFPNNTGWFGNVVSEFRWLFLHENHDINLPYHHVEWRWNISYLFQLLGARWCGFLCVSCELHSLHTTMQWLHLLSGSDTDPKHASQSTGRHPKWDLKRPAGRSEPYLLIGSHLVCGFSRLGSCQSVFSLPVFHTEQSSRLENAYKINLDSVLGSSLLICCDLFQGSLFLCSIVSWRKMYASNGEYIYVVVLSSYRNTLVKHKFLSCNLQFCL